jgi:hypothetical protein
MLAKRRTGVMIRAVFEPKDTAVERGYPAARQRLSRYGMNTRFEVPGSNLEDSA